jgi:hypothetical protein
MSTERIYNLLEQEEEQSQQSSKDEDSQDNDCSASEQDTQSSNGGAGDEDDDVPSMPKTLGGIGQVLDTPEPDGEEGESVADQARDSQMGTWRAWRWQDASGRTAQRRGVQGCERGLA